MHDKSSKYMKPRKWPSRVGCLLGIGALLFLPYFVLIALCRIGITTDAIRSTMLALADNPIVPALFRYGGSALIIGAVITGIIRRVRHGKCPPDPHSDLIALRCFLVAVLFISFNGLMLSLPINLEIYAWTSGLAAALSIIGILLAARAKHWRYVFIFFFLLLFLASLAPAH